MGFFDSPVGKGTTFNAGDTEPTSGQEDPEKGK